eukprot:scaffold3537_cov167-Amphora_coffeaeformis.AAC.2
MVRHFWESNLWGLNEEGLHDITLFVLCQKLGVTTTLGKTRANMLSQLREFRNPDKQVGEVRGWKLPSKYNGFSGFSL